MTPPLPLHPAVLRIRNSRTPIGMTLTAGSIIAGLGGAVSDPLRSGAVEGSFSDTLAIGWYLVLLLGGLALLYAISSPCWQDPPPETQSRWQQLTDHVVPLFSRPWCSRVCPDTYPKITARLYADQIGHYIVGWQWTSYGVAALARQGAGGFTAFTVASLILGLYTFGRVVQLHRDTRDLRAWRSHTRITAEEE